MQALRLEAAAGDALRPVSWPLFTLSFISEHYGRHRADSYEITWKHLYAISGLTGIFAIGRACHAQLPDLAHNFDSSRFVLIYHPCSEFG
jgi:hypothetical protein